MANVLHPHHFDAPARFRSRLHDDLLAYSDIDGRFIDQNDEPEFPTAPILMGYVLTAFSGACVGSMLTSAALLAWKWVA